jgi:serine/threonine protein kinase
MVSLKVTRREFQQDPKAVGRFLDMAKIAARLCHPNIAPVYEAGEDDGLCYVASAFILGRPLAEAIAAGPLEPRRAARIVAELAEALDHGHRRQIVHRDVKPSSILLDADDRPHLRDFGLSRYAGAGEKLTHLGTVLKSPAYLAPEQVGVRGSEPGAAGDQYSLGVILYELLSGRVPFPGPLEVVIPQALLARPPSLCLTHPEIPAELEAVCLKTLAKQPEDRYPTCRDLSDDLNRWLAGRPIAAAAPLPASMAPSPPGGEADAGSKCGQPPVSLIPPAGEVAPSTERSGSRSGLRGRLSWSAPGGLAACIVLAAILGFARTGHRAGSVGPVPAAPAPESPILAVDASPESRPKPGPRSPDPERPPPSGLQVPPRPLPALPAPPPPPNMTDVITRAEPRSGDLGRGDPIELAGSSESPAGRTPRFDDLKEIPGYFILTEEYKVDRAVQDLIRPRKDLERDLSWRKDREAEWANVPRVRSELTARRDELEVTLQYYGQYLSKVESKAAEIALVMLNDPWGELDGNKGFNWAFHPDEELRIRAFNAFLSRKLNVFYPGWAASVATMENHVMNLFRIKAQLARLTPESIEEFRHKLNGSIDQKRKRFAHYVRTARGLADRTQKSYKVLARDPEVQKKIEEANRRQNSSARLGPSDQFRRNVRILEEIEKLLASLREAAEPPASTKDGAAAGQEGGIPWKKTGT